MGRDGTEDIHTGVQGIERLCITLYTNALYLCCIFRLAI